MGYMDQAVKGAEDHYGGMYNQAKQATDHDGDKNYGTAGTIGEVLGGIGGVALGAPAMLAGLGPDAALSMGAVGAGVGGSAFDYLFGD